METFWRRAPTNNETRTRRRRTVRVPCGSPASHLSFSNVQPAERRPRAGIEPTTVAIPAVPSQPVARIGYSGAMSSNVSIEVDKLTADKLQARAAELGLTVPQSIAELAALTATLGTRTARRSPS